MSRWVLKLDNWARDCMRSADSDNDSHLSNERSARKRQTRDEHVTVEHKARKQYLQKKVR